MVELHYDNPKLEVHRHDSSGIKLYFTPKLREYDLGLLMTGADGSPFSIQLPGEAEDLSLRSFCYPFCTEVIIRNYIKTKFKIY